MGKFIDLTGKRFGRLTVIERAENHISKSGKTYVQWLCKCDCGNEVVVMGQSLTANLTKSCGCWQKDFGHISGKGRKKYNTYDLSGEYGIGYTYKGEGFYFDLEDYDKIKNYCWYINSLGYVAAHEYSTDKSSKRNHILLHRVIMNNPYNMVIDHINHNKFDNRKSNIRVCTQHQNTMNCKRPINNTSGVKGVRFNKINNNLEASIVLNYKTIRLGHFNDFNDAVNARRSAEEKYFGEYAYPD